MNFDSIILDIDGTIWNTTEVVAAAWNDAIDYSGLNADKVTPKILQGEFGKPMDVIALDLWPNLDDEQRDVLLKLCCEFEHKAVQNNQTDITYPNVVETVKKLSEKINFYVVSNCQSGYIELTLKKTGLAPFIKDFECFGDTGLQKDENIALLIKRNNLEKPVYVGDTQGDCNACKKCGVPFIWASYGFGTADEFVAKVGDFSELEKLI